MVRRVVTARQLSRQTSAILTTVAEEGAPITVSRGGIPIAELRPLRLTPWVPTEADEACGVVLPDVDLQALALDHHQRTLMTVCPDGFSPDEAIQALGTSTGELALGLMRLELKGLVRKTSGGGYFFTELGREVAQVLRAEAATA